MTPFGPYYPLALESVMRHAERLTELLTLRERGVAPHDAGGAWITGRAAELRCVATVIGRDWHDGTVSADAAAARLAQHIKQLHEGLAEHLGLQWPSCCRPNLSRASSVHSTASRGRPPAAEPGLPTIATDSAASRGRRPA
jgi:hypothetical protein